ncbi:MAG: hypothetical protein H7836_17865, partial [Magnetococcus sp. YQC-3]
MSVSWRVGVRFVFAVAVAFAPVTVWAGSSGGADGPSLLGIPLDFILFAVVLLGVALFHHSTLQVALTGITTIIIYKLIFTGFAHGDG